MKSLAQLLRGPYGYITLVAAVAGLCIVFYRYPSVYLQLIGAWFGCCLYMMFSGTWVRFERAVLKKIHAVIPLQKAQHRQVHEVLFITAFPSMVVYIAIHSLVTRFMRLPGLSGFSLGQFNPTQRVVRDTANSIEQILHQQQLRARIRSIEVAHDFVTFRAVVTGRSSSTETALAKTADALERTYRDVYIRERGTNQVDILINTDRVFPSA